MANVEVPPDKQQDPFVIYEIGTTRDGVRTPMQWSTEANAGFTGEAVEPWLPISGDYKRVNVEVEKQDEGSMLWLYKRLLELRRDTPALNIGSYQPLGDVPEDVYGYWREAESRALVLLNFSAETKEVTLPEENWRVILSTELDRQGNAGVGLELRPFEGIILQPQG